MGFVTLSSTGLKVNPNLLNFPRGKFSTCKLYNKASGGRRKGKTLEQILNVPDSEKRNQEGSDVELQDHLPRALSHQWFVDEVLVRFNQVLVRNMIAKMGIAQFPIFHRIHPANVIPHRKNGDEWVFNITDLSCSLPVDYAIFLAREKL